MEAHLGTYASTPAKQEDLAECIAGAVGAEAGWDVYAMADYTWGLETDSLHGTGDHRYEVLLDGADYGHEYCEATYLS